MAPQIIFGTATFGMDGSDFQDTASIKTALQAIKDAGVKRLDSGARYPPLNPGRSEQLIGLSGELGDELFVDTKVYADARNPGDGELTAEAIEKSLIQSLSRLSTSQVNVLHIHRADPLTPIVEQVRSFNKQIKDGKCRAWGVSNVPVAMLEEMLRVCDEEDLQKPVCYQGEYNVVTRGMETRLLPLLRQHGISFNAFRLLAAGFLTGKFLEGNHAGTRFDGHNPLGKATQKLFESKVLQDAVRRFHDTAASQKITTLEVAIRWIAYHSALASTDGIIFGASTTRQIVESLDMLRNGPLPDALLQPAQDLWDAVKDSRAEIM